MQNEGEDMRPSQDSTRPLLGDVLRVGKQQDVEAPMRFNLLSLNALGAQGGIAGFVLVVWFVAFVKADVIFFTPHPVLNSVGLFVVTIGVLLLQPTHTASQKRDGAVLHSVVFGAASACFLVAFIIIFINKKNHDAPHFVGAHALCGITTYLLFLIQALVGTAQYYFPSLFGSVERAKAVYKYHRLSGYAVYTLLLTTAMLGTQTPWAQNAAGMFWPYLLLLILGFVGVVVGVRGKKIKLF